MVDGLGVTGVEGVFRIACEITMQLLRDNRDSLMSMLNAFIHDPLVEWEDEKKKMVSGQATQHYNQLHSLPGSRSAQRCQVFYRSTASRQECVTPDRTKVAGNLLALLREITDTRCRRRKGDLNKQFGPDANTRSDGRCQSGELFIQNFQSRLGEGATGEDVSWMGSVALIVLSFEVTLGICISQ